MSQQNSISLTTKVIKNNDLLTTAVDDEVVMLSMETDKYYGLDPLSTSIWDLLDESRTLSEVCEELLVSFDVDQSTCQQDVLEFVNKLFDSKLVKVVSST